MQRKVIFLVVRGDAIFGGRSCFRWLNCEPFVLKKLNYLLCGLDARVAGVDLKKLFTFIMSWKFAARLVRLNRKLEKTFLRSFKFFLLRFLYPPAFLADPLMFRS